MNCRHVIALVSCGAGVLFLSLVAHSDEITLVPGTTVKSTGGRIIGKVQSETPNVVTIQPNAGGTSEVPVDQIDSIVYTDQTPALTLAQTREKNGDTAGALEQYKKAVADVGGAKTPAAASAHFGYASSLADLARNDASRLDETIGLLEQFVTANPSNHSFGPALIELTKLALQKKDMDRAEQALTKLSTVRWASGSAAVLKAKVLIAKGKAETAVSEMDKLIGDLPEGSAQRTEARLVRAAGLLANKKQDEAETALREIIKDAGPEQADVQATAHNLLGDCLQATGKIKDALFAYMQTDILYDRNKEEDARALSQIAQLWRKLQQNARADEATALLRERYPKSPYLETAAPKP